MGVGSQVTSVDGMKNQGGFRENFGINPGANHSWYANIPRSFAANDIRASDWNQVNSGSLGGRNMVKV